MERGKLTASWIRGTPTMGKRVSCVDRHTTRSIMLIVANNQPYGGYSMLGHQHPLVETQGIYGNPNDVRESRGQLKSRGRGARWEYQV